MTRNAEHTPSPQSVVVPGSAWERFLYRSDFLRGAAVVDGHDVSLRSFASLVEELKAAAAPSSLAGGDVTDEWADRFCEAVNWSPDGQECKTVEGELRCTTFRQIAKGHILSAIATNPYPDNAALSPEAPAREWSTDDMRELVTDDQVRWLVSATDVAQGRARLKDILNALTPRHEAPAEGWSCPANHDDYARMGHGACPYCRASLEGIRAAFMVPAEGAGERDRMREIDTLTRQVTPDLATAQWLLASIQEITEPALRARSSAPEAREGEAVDHKPECWGSTSYSGEMAHCYCSQSTAAPSADKLQVLDAVGDYLIKQYGKSYGLHHPVDRARILAALKGDAK